MTRQVAKGLALAGAFVVVNFLGIGLWATSQRKALRGPVEERGRTGARAVLALLASQEDQGTLQRRLDQLVKERGMLGALIMEEGGTILARAGDVGPPVLEAARQKASPKPTSHVVNERLVFQEHQKDGPRVAVVVEDMSDMENTWRSTKKRAVTSAVLALLFAPAFGFLIAKLFPGGMKAAS